MFHTGTGATSATGGNSGATCDASVSTVPAERTVFTLNTSIMAVAEAATGRMGAGQLRRFTSANAAVQLDPSVRELPGAMPEISPSPDFGANIDRLFTDRSMALQAWGTYGILWPVVHFELGVFPDLGRGTVRVVPQVPTGQHRVSGASIRLGGGAIDVVATRSTGRLTTVVHRDRRVRLTIGAVLPAGASVQTVRLNGRPVRHHVANTARGKEVRANAGRGRGNARLVVTLR
jgi:hypothetical protein